MDCTWASAVTECARQALSLRTSIKAPRGFLLSIVRSAFTTIDITEPRKSWEAWAEVDYGWVWTSAHIAYLISSPNPAVKVSFTKWFHKNTGWAASGFFRFFSFIATPSACRGRDAGSCCSTGLFSMVHIVAAGTRFPNPSKWLFIARSTGVVNQVLRSWIGRSV